MTEITRNLQRIWDCIEKKAPEVKDLFQPGLKPEEIDEITKDFPFRLPQEVYELYQWKNGLFDNVGLEYYGSGNALVGIFNALQKSRYIKKIDTNGEVFYFLIIFCFSGELGLDFLCIPLGIDKSPIIILYDDDDYEYFDLDQEFQNQQYNNRNLNSTQIRNFYSRKRYSNLADLIAEMAEFAENAFYSLKRDEHFIKIDLDRQKTDFIHYRYRFADKSIFCITPEQEVKLFEIKKRWLNLINQALNKEQATIAIQELYRYAEEEIPEIIFVPSLYTVHLGFFEQSDFLKIANNNYLTEKLKSLYWDFLLVPFDYALKEHIITPIMKSLKSELTDVLNDCMEYDLKSSLDKIFNDDINSNFKSITDTLNSALKYDLRDALGKEFILLYFNNYKHILNNDEFIASAALFEFAHLLGVKFNEQKLNLFISFCREIWCVIPFDKTMIVCEKPKVLWKEHHLAYINKQPDISFSDGYSI